MAALRCVSVSSRPLPHSSKHQPHEGHLHLGIEVREIIAVSLPQFVDELPQLPLQGIPVVFEALEDLLQLFAHLAGVGRVLVGEADDVVAGRVLHLRGAGAAAALRLQAPSRTRRR